MSDVERGLLDKLDHWDALWHRGIKLPISKEEADLIRLCLQKITDGEQ